MLLVLNPEHPQPRKLQKAAELLRQGEILVYPTDTGYGIGCDPFQRKVVERMFRLLSRPTSKPAALLCSDFKQVAIYGHISDSAYRVGRRIFPGPYTLILKATKQIPRPLQGKRKEVGIRVPNHAVTLQLIEAFENPILNLTVTDGQGNYLDDPREVEDLWGKQLGAVIDCDLIPEDPSTVVDLTGREPEILRVGQGDPEVFM